MIVFLLYNTYWTFFNIYLNEISNETVKIFNLNKYRARENVVKTCIVRDLPGDKLLELKLCQVAESSPPVVTKKEADQRALTKSFNKQLQKWVLKNAGEMQLQRRRNQIRAKKR